MHGNEALNGRVSPMPTARLPHAWGKETKRNVKSHGYTSPFVKYSKFYIQGGSQKGSG